MIKEKGHAALNHSAINEESEDEDDEEEEDKLRINNLSTHRDSSVHINNDNTKEPLSNMMQRGIKQKLLKQGFLKKEKNSDVLIPQVDQEENILGDNT